MSLVKKKSRLKVNKPKNKPSKTSHERRASNKTNITIYLDKELKDQFKKLVEDEESNITEELTRYIQERLEQKVS